MSVLIATQKQMNDRRRAIDDCYICGTALPPKGPGRRAQLVAEHVVPRSLLGPVPAIGADAWPVLLNVHKACEKRHKHYRDHLINLLHALANRPPDAWSEQDIGLLQREFSVSQETGDGAEPVYSIGGVDDAMLAPVLWVRGLHATLYGEVLPEELHAMTNPPVPIWNKEDGGAAEGLLSDQVRRRHLLTFLRVAIHTQHVDEIRAWGGNLVYQCAWREAVLKDGGRWGCTWALEFPGVSDWAMMGTGADAPWHGYYQADELPPNCSIVGQAEIDQYNAHVDAVRKSQQK